MNKLYIKKIFFFIVKNWNNKKMQCTIFNAFKNTIKIGAILLIWGKIIIYATW